jgi:hypothetical protein
MAAAAAIASQCKRAAVALASASPSAAQAQARRVAGQAAKPGCGESTTGGADNVDTRDFRRRIRSSLYGLPAGAPNGPPVAQPNASPPAWDS